MIVAELPKNDHFPFDKLKAVVSSATGPIFLIWGEIRPKIVLSILLGYKSGRIGTLAPPNPHPPQTMQGLKGSRTIVVQEELFSSVSFDT